MIFKAGDAVQRNREDARYTGTVKETYQAQDGAVMCIIEWPVRGAKDGIQTTVLAGSELKKAPIREPEGFWEWEADEMAAGATAVRSAKGSGKVAAQKAAGASRTSATAPKTDPKAIVKKPGEGNLVTRLTAPEKTVLARCVRTIKTAQAADLEAIAALEIIRDKRLYRESADSFEVFCEREFGIGRNIVNKNIQSGRVIRAIEPLLKAAGEADGVPVPLPQTLTQVRPLFRLKETQDQADAYLDAVSAAGAKPLTERLIGEAVQRKLGPVVIAAGTNGSSGTTTASNKPAAYKPVLPWIKRYSVTVDERDYVIEHKPDGSFTFSVDDFFIGSYDGIEKAFETAEGYIASQHASQGEAGDSQDQGDTSNPE